MSNDRFDLSGKVAVVVGATKGMGAAIAELFVAGGARASPSTAGRQRRSPSLQPA